MKTHGNRELTVYDMDIWTVEKVMWLADKMEFCRIHLTI